MTDLEKIKLLTGESDDALLSLLLEDAKDYVLDQTNRTWIPAKLKKLVRDIALLSYNRLGTEGESSRAEGGISISYFDLPTNIQAAIINNRLVRCGGRAFEQKEP